MQIIERSLSGKSDGVAGYLVYPERTNPGPGLLLIHPKSGVTDYIKIEARKFARLGYSTFALNVFEQLGYPAPTHIETGSQIQAKTSDADFTRVQTEGWRYLLSQPHVDTKRVAVCGYCMGGRIAIHFVAATPEVRAFVGYYPTVRDEPATPMRPVWTSFTNENLALPFLAIVQLSPFALFVGAFFPACKRFFENGSRKACAARHEPGPFFP